jgi:hypothetical protein
VEPAETAVAREQLGKHASPATDIYAKRAEAIKAVFSM